MDNWLVAVVAGAFLLGLIIGIARGAIKITVSLLATIVTFVLVFFLTPYVSKGITKMTPAQDVLETKIESTIAGMVMGDSEEARMIWQKWEFRGIFWMALISRVQIMGLSHWKTSKFHEICRSRQSRMRTYHQYLRICF